MAKRPQSFLVTCEHGGNRVPAAYRQLFTDATRLLESHRGYDVGALSLAREIARQLDADLVYATTTRLLVDLNRSPSHLQAFSQITRALPAAERAKILACHHTPYRQRVEDWIAARLSTGHRVFHLSCHSFTPVLAGACGTSTSDSCTTRRVLPRSLGRTAGTPRCARSIPGCSCGAIIRTAESPTD